MKKLLILLLAVSPLFLTAQEDRTTDETKSREERAREIQERNESARRAQAQQRRPGSGVNPNMPTNTVYAELVMTIRDGKTKVEFPMDASLKAAAGREDAEVLSKLSAQPYESLIAALNAAAKYDWTVVSSYEVELKNAREIHFIISKEVPLTPEAIRERNQSTREVSGRSGGTRGGGERSRSRDRR